MKKLYILSSLTAAGAEITIHEPEGFNSSDDALAALTDRYEEAISRKDIFESEIDKEELTAYVITDSDEYIVFAVHEIEID